MMNRTVCTVIGCSRSHWARGLCRRHYERWHRGTIKVTATLHRDLVEPRYCTCTDPLPDPEPWGECPDCHRLVESHAIT